MNRPKVVVSLVGEDGNAFTILGRVIKAMKRASWSKEEIDQYVAEAKGGDYNNLLAVTQKYTEEPDGFDDDEEENYEDEESV